MIRDICVLISFYPSKKYFEYKITLFHGVIVCISSCFNISILKLKLQHWDCWFDPEVGREPWWRHVIFTPPLTELSNRGTLFVYEIFISFQPEVRSEKLRQVIKSGSYSCLLSRRNISMLFYEIFRSSSMNENVKSSMWPALLPPFCQFIHVVFAFFFMIPIHFLIFDTPREFLFIFHEVKAHLWKYVN